MAEDESGWQLTESDPGVFTELLKQLGVSLLVDELYGLDADDLARLQPIHALIFLFKWVGNSDEGSGMQGTYDASFPGFFAHQVVNNACASLAVLNALCNVPSLATGPQLQDLINFTAGMDPQTAGLTITSSDFFREAHNSLSPPSAVSLEGLGLPKKKGEDAYHFVVYVPVAGMLYELDGLKRSPVKHAAVDEKNWTSKALEVLQARIATYPPGSIDFGLLAIHDDPLPSYQANLDKCQAAHDEAGAADLMVKISEETEKRKRWAFENSLRRHNHVGLIHALTVALAKSGRLPEVTTKAKDKMKERIAKRKNGQEMDED